MQCASHKKNNLTISARGNVSSAIRQGTGPPITRMKGLPLVTTKDTLFHRNGTLVAELPKEEKEEVFKKMEDLGF
jgi:hypothetical protein